MVESSDSRQNGHNATWMFSHTDKAYFVACRVCRWISEPYKTGNEAREAFVEHIREPVKP